MSESILKKANSTQYHLTKIVAETQSICQEICELGELSTELEARFDFTSNELATTVDRAAMTSKQLEVHAAFWKEQALACQAMACRFERTHEKLKEHIKGVMKFKETSELQGHTHRYVLSAVKPRLVVQGTELPREFILIETREVPDKEKIRAALKEGKEVPGAHLETSYALRPYLNSKKVGSK